MHQMILCIHKRDVADEEWGEIIRMNSRSSDEIRQHLCPRNQSLKRKRAPSVLDDFEKHTAKAASIFWHQ